MEKLHALIRYVDLLLVCCAWVRKRRGCLSLGKETDSLVSGVRLFIRYAGSFPVGWRRPSFFFTRYVSVVFLVLEPFLLCWWRAEGRVQVSLRWSVDPLRHLLQVIVVLDDYGRELDVHLLLRPACLETLRLQPSYVSFPHSRCDLILFEGHQHKVKSLHFRAKMFSDVVEVNQLRVAVEEGIDAVKLQELEAFWIAKFEIRKGLHFLFDQLN